MGWLGWVPTQYDWSPSKKERLGHRQTQEHRDQGTIMWAHREKVTICKLKETDLRRNQSCRYLDLGLPTSNTMKKICVCSWSPHGMWHFIRVAQADKHSCLAWSTSLFHLHHLRWLSEPQPELSHKGNAHLLFPMVSSPPTDHSFAPCVFPLLSKSFPPSPLLPPNLCLQISVDQSLPNFPSKACSKCVVPIVSSGVAVSSTNTCSQRLCG